jgi:hypothetical protein
MFETRRMINSEFPVAFLFHCNFHCSTAGVLVCQGSKLRICEYYVGTDPSPAVERCTNWRLCQSPSSECGAECGRGRNVFGSSVWDSDPRSGELRPRRKCLAHRKLVLTGRCSA